MTAKDAKGAASPVMLSQQQALWLELMQFYIREAWLLDERKYKEWLDLFTDDVLYFMPRRKNVPRPKRPIFLSLPIFTALDVCLRSGARERR